MQRRHAISRLMLPDWVPTCEAFTMAGAAGFGAVELSAESDHESARDVLAAIRSTGIGVNAVVARHPTAPAYFDRVGDELDAHIDIGLVAIRNAADWDACMVLVTPGLVDASTSAEVSWRRSADVIAARLAPVAEQLGVVIGIENTWRSPLLTARELALYVDELSSPAVGAHLDVGNVTFGHPEHWINALGDRLVGVHYKDYSMHMRWGRGYFRFGMVGAGAVDWTKVDAAFTDVGYDGWLTHAGIPVPGPLRLLNRVDRSIFDPAHGSWARLRKALYSIRRRHYAAWLHEIGRRAAERDATLDKAASAPI